MVDPRLIAWAKLLVEYSVAITPGQVVALGGGIAAESLLRALHRAVIIAGGHPVVLPHFSGLSAMLLAHGSDDQLQYVSPIEWWEQVKADASIYVLADSNTKTLSGIDPAREVIASLARADLVRESMRRSAAGEIRWTLTLYPTDAFAQDAEMATEDFAEFVFAACKLDAPDPVAAWQRLATDQQRLIAWLADKQEVRLIGPDTDLTLSIAGRTWMNADGHLNLPDGEIFTGPVETSVNGHVRFSYPASTGGREVEDVRLRFVDGQVVDATAKKNEAYLIQTLDTDPGARVLGEFAVGTNTGITRFTKNPLFDEKIGGTVHMALGAGYPETGSCNESAIHWDLICDLRQGGRMEVDGRPFLVDGQVVVAS